MSDDIGLSYEETLAEDLQDEAFREAYERLGPAYEIARLRMERGLTQKQLARLVGTRQSSISRLESWDHEPSLSFLRRVARALGARVEVRITNLETAEEPVSAEDGTYAMTIVHGFGIGWSEATISTSTASETVTLTPLSFGEA